MIREMTASDIDAVTELYENVLTPTYISFGELNEGKAECLGRLSPRAVTIFREQLVSLTSSPVHGFFVAVSEDRIIGFALASLQHAEAGHIVCWLDDIGVGKPWQNRGIGQALVEKVYDWGAERNAKYYLLESGIANESAHRLFEQLGFKPLAAVFYRPAPDGKS